MRTSREADRQYRKRYYEANKPVLREKQKEYVKARLRGPDGDHVRELRTEAVRRHRQRRPEDWKRWNKERFERLKSAMVAAYGGRCVCCGETAVPFLTIDHIRRDGAAHRRQIGRGGTTAYLDLKRRGWPQDGFRLLCMNCNFATRYGSPCPHELERLLVVPAQQCT